MSTYKYELSGIDKCVTKDDNYYNGHINRYTYSKTTGAYIYTYYQSVDENNDRVIEQRMYTDHNADLPDYITDNDTVYEKATIELTLKGYSTNNHIMGIFILVPNEEFAEDAQTIWNQIGTSTSIDRKTVGIGVTTTQTVTITDQDIIKRFLNFGIAIRSTNSPTSFGYHKDLAVCTNISVTLEFQSNKLPPEISINNPLSGGYHSVSEKITVGWNYTQSANVVPDKFILLYNSKNGWEKWEELSGEIRSIDTYASIIPRISDAGIQNVNICIRCFIGNFYYDSEPISINICYVDTYNMTPSGGVIQMISDEIKLKWVLSLSNDVPEGITITEYPTTYNILYSINSGESWIVAVENAPVEIVDGEYRYTILPNTLPAGIITWKASPVIDGYVITTYHKENFVVRVQASTSSITCDGKPQPTLSWVSSSQVAYQVRFADFDSGAIYGTETSYTIPYYYADGNYPVQVRTQASNGVWSDWTELEYVAITNITAAGEITLTAKASRHAVVVNWETTTNYVNYILYRNNIPIYVGADSTYTDIGANGNAIYILRGIASNGYYTQSNTVNVDATPKIDCIYDMESKSWIQLKLSLSSRSRNYAKSVQTYYKYYAGRTKPIAFTESNTEHSLSVSYAFKTREEAERILNLAGKTVIYKDTNGGIIIGILTDPAYQSERVYPVSFTIDEIDYNEEVKYEAVSV